MIRAGKTDRIIGKVATNFIFDDVSPDLVEGRRIFESKFYDNVIAQSNVSLGNLDDHPEMVRILQAIERGRELERAGAKPGMVWKEHDGSNHCPVDPDSYVWIKNSYWGEAKIFKANAVGWPNFTHYAIITPPAEDK